jgi:hypothetical protein
MLHMVWCSKESSEKVGGGMKDRDANGAFGVSLGKQVNFTLAHDLESHIAFVLSHYYTRLTRC